MSRLMRIAIVMLVPAAAVVAIALSAYRPGPPGRVELAVYSYLTSLARRGDTVQQIAHASRPWSFTPQMSRVTFGSRVYYETTYDDQASGGWNLPATATPWPNEMPSKSKGLRPLPFPPVDLWCVALRRADLTSPIVVFVAQHQDMYVAEWVLHEPPSENAEELRVILSSVGCDVALDR